MTCHGPYCDCPMHAGVLICQANMIRHQRYFMVTCPCCKGKKRMTLVEHDEIEGRTILTHPLCTHCQGKGEVEAEAEE